MCKPPTRYCATRFCTIRTAAGPNKYETAPHAAPVTKDPTDVEVGSRLHGVQMSVDIPASKIALMASFRW